MVIFSVRLLHLADAGVGAATKGSLLIAGCQIVIFSGTVYSHEKRSGFWWGLQPMQKKELRTYVFECTTEQERHSWLHNLVERGASLAGVVSVSHNTAFDYILKKKMAALKDEEHEKEVLAEGWLFKQVSFRPTSVFSCFLASFFCRFHSASMSASYRRFCMFFSYAGTRPSKLDEAICPVYPYSAHVLGR